MGPSSRSFWVQGSEIWDGDSAQPVGDERACRLASEACLDSVDVHRAARLPFPACPPAGRSHRSMKLLRSSSVPGVLEHLRTVLEAEGIQCQMRNEMTAGLSAAVPVSESVPELWVVDDDMVPRALEVVGDIETQPGEGGESWVCSNCGELLEAQFGSCWKCNTPKSG